MAGQSSSWERGRRKHPDKAEPGCGLPPKALCPRTVAQHNCKSVIDYVDNVDANPQETALEPRGLLKETIAARLREEILAGRIAPGQKIIEGRWARQYGVAQVSIREALNILTVDGFVTKGHGRSARVVNLNDADIAHIYGVRGVLEGLAARIITQRKLPVDDLETAFAALQTEVQKNDLRAVIGCVQRFHLLLFEKPGNPFLQEYGRRLVIPLYAFTLIRALAKNLTATPWDQQLSKHRLIIDVIKLGDPSLAEQTLIHVTNSFLEAALTVWAH
jgi:DNA-binding GntR family transcriptional regulator